MANISSIADWVVRRLKRPDVLDQSVENAANFYVLLGNAVPFEELETITPERSFVAGQYYVDISDLSIAGIMSIRITYGTGRTRRLKRSHTRVYDALGSAVPGPPATYARFAKTLEFNPVPDSSSYTYRLRYWKAPTLSTNVADTELLISDPWLELMRYETLFRTYTDLEMYEKANMLVAPMPLPKQQGSPHIQRVTEYGIIPKLWNDLLRTVKQRENVDEDFSINPVVRNYTRV